MRQAGRIVALVLAELRTAAQAGVTTATLDRLASEIIAREGESQPSVDTGDTQRQSAHQ